MSEDDFRQAIVALGNPKKLPSVSLRHVRKLEIDAGELEDGIVDFHVDSADEPCTESEHFNQ